MVREATHHTFMQLTLRQETILYALAIVVHATGLVILIGTFYRGLSVLFLTYHRFHNFSERDSALGTCLDIVDGKSTASSAYIHFAN